MPRDLERSLYRLQTLNVRHSSVLDLAEQFDSSLCIRLARTLNQPAAPFLLGNVRGLELLL